MHCLISKFLEEMIYRCLWHGEAEFPNSFRAVREFKCSKCKNFPAYCRGPEVALKIREKTPEAEQLKLWGDEDEKKVLA
jgi:hypothetical protein